MKQKLLFLCLSIAALSWNACNCPPDEKAGDLSLGTQAADFLPYAGGETLVFVNELGEALQFTAPNGAEINSDQLCYRTTCTEAKYNSPSSCDYYAAESRRYSFFSTDNNVVLDVLVYSDVYKYGEAEFYDALQVSFGYGPPSIVGHHVIEGRFSDPVQLSELAITDFFELQPSFTINGQSFSDVLLYEEGSLGVYVQQGVGVIGFKAAGHSWVIQ